MAGLSGHTSGAAVVAVTISMTVLAGLAVATRLFTRLRIVKEPGLDDGVILLALLFSIATTVTMCLQVRWGMGQHMATLSLDQIVKMGKAFYISIWVYNLSMSCTKFSILLQYLRIFPQRSFRVICYIMIGMIAIYACWTFFSAVFACWPIAYFWDPISYPNGRCLNRFAVWSVLSVCFSVCVFTANEERRFANTGMNISTDIAIGVLPLPMLKGLQLPKRQKIALMIVFGLGGFTCVVSILRLQSLYVVSRARDITWENPMAAMWSSVEINTAMLCSCLPTLRRLISRVFPRIFSTNQSRNSPKDQPRDDSNATTPQPSFGIQARKSLEALGRSLTGIGDTGLLSNVNTRTDIECEEVDEEQPETRPHVDDGQIQVITVVEQEVEKIHEQRLDQDKA